ncbi:MAG: DUF4153 domain-containing protein [Ruthenibacterium sp.]
MGKAKEFVLSLTRQLRGGVQRFAPTFAWSIVLWLIYFVSLCTPFGFQLFASSVTRSVVVPCLLGGCVMGMAAGVCAQLLCERAEKLPRFLPAAVSLLLAAGAAAALYFGRDTTVWPMAFAGVLCALGCAAFWLLYTRENEALLFGWLLKCGAFSGLLSLVLMLGMMLCYGAFDALLLAYNDAGDIFVLIGIFCAAVVFPVLFLAQVPQRGRQEPLTLPRAYDVLMGGVALPLYGLLLVILCGYVIKIVLTWHMPSGEMNWYASFALLAYLVLWLGLRTHENKLVRRAVRWGWVLLLPVLAAQITGIVIRISAYGLTTPRYLSLACLAVGLFGLLLAALQWHAKWLFAAAAAVALVVTLTPLNAVNVPYWEQSARLKSTLLQNGMYDSAADQLTPAQVEIPADDKSTIYSAYTYLRYNAPQPCNDAFYRTAVQGGESFEAMYGFDGSTPAAHEYSSAAYESSMQEGIDIAEYTRLYAGDECNAQRVSADENFVMNVRVPGEDVLYKCNLRTYLETLARDYGAHDAQISAADAAYRVSDTLTLYFRRAEITYYNGTMTGAWFDSYLLEK